MTAIALYQYELFLLGKGISRQQVSPQTGRLRGFENLRSNYSILVMQVKLQRERVLLRMVREVTGGLPKDQVIVGFGSGWHGWYKGCISRRSVFSLKADWKRHAFN